MTQPRARAHHRKLAWSFALSLAACAVGVTAAALLVSPRSRADFNRSYTISEAATVYITPRGLDNFTHRQLPGILARNHINLNHQELPEWHYDEDTEFDLGHLPPGLRAYQGTLNFLRGSMRDWLMNFSLRNPLFHVKVREAGYDLEGLDLNLRVDPELTAQWHSGLVVVMEATIPHLRAYARDICGYDSHNPMFGSCRANEDLIRDCKSPHPRNPDLCARYQDGFGLYHPWIELVDQEPIRISVPVRVQILSGGSVQFEAVNVTTNFDQLRYSWGQDRNLLLPTVELEVGSQRSRLNPGPLVTAIMSRERDVVELGLHHLKDFIAQELPHRMTTMALDRLQQSFETVKEVSPPGIDTFGDGSMLQWGLRPRTLEYQENGNIALKLDGYVADPDMTWDEHLPMVPPRLPPVLAGRGARDYDFAFVINEAVIQRIIYLGFRRGGLEPIGLKDKDHHCEVRQHATIVQSPVISAADGGHANLDVRLQLARDGSVSEWWALADPFQVVVGLDIRADLVLGDARHANSFNLVLDHADPGRSFVDSRYIEHSADAVPGRLRATLADTTCGSLSRNLTDTPIEVPKDLFGLPIRLEHVEFDPHGYLVLYMSYGEPRT